jgi:hypothetical protein
MVSETIQRDLLNPPWDSAPREPWTWHDSVVMYELLVRLPQIGRWVPRPNPNAGLRESAWLREHRDELARREGGTWVAILGEDVIERGASMLEVYTALKDDGIEDALVVFIRPFEEGQRARRMV